MKNLVKLSVFICIAIFALSCDSEDDNAVAQAMTAPRIVTPAAALELDEVSATNPAFTLVWDHGDYDVDTQINYTIEMSLSGTGFAEPKNVGQTSNRFFTWSVEELNNEVIGVGLVGGEQGFVELRVTSSLGSEEFGNQTSETTLLTVTPYEEIVIVVPEFIDLFLVGNATDSNKDGIADDGDWVNNGINSYLFRDPDNKNIFSFTGNFGEKEFKLLEKKDNWQPQWGLDGSSLSNSTILGGDPAPFVVGAAGYYTLTVDTEALTYSLVAFDASAAEVYTGMELMGDATNSEDADNDGTPDGWQTGLQFERSDFDPHVWYKNDVVIGEGQAKFRANMNWDIAFGGSSFPTALDTSGDNIPTVPGTYDIWFNDITKSYIFVAKN